MTTPARESLQPLVSKSRSGEEGSKQPEPMGLVEKDMLEDDEPETVGETKNHNFVSTCLDTSQMLACLDASQIVTITMSTKSFSLSPPTP